MTKTVPSLDANPVASALQTLTIEQAGLSTLANALNGSLGEALERAVATIRDMKGRVIVTGVGKSGHISAKIAATLASTGTPAFFVHPSEANHGDLGMIARDDVIIAASWSGETTELGGILDYSKRFSIPLIALTAGENSTLAGHADTVLLLPREKEACPHNLAPTTSSMMTLAMGDCLAIALLESRHFTAGDFRVFHPGGKLGAQLKLVGDLMHKGEAVPLVSKSTRMSQVILSISERGFGCAGVTDEDGRLCGIITDGDLRRNLADDLLSREAASVMTHNPRTVPADMLAAQALEIMNGGKVAITSLFVTEDGRPTGILHIHDLLRVGVA